MQDDKVAPGAAAALLDRRDERAARAVCAGHADREIPGGPPRLLGFEGAARIHHTARGHVEERWRLAPRAVWWELVLKQYLSLWRAELNVARGLLNVLRRVLQRIVPKGQRANQRPRAASDRSRRHTS